MRVLIAGIDGYLGWPLALHLAGRGHRVAGIDALLRRRWVREMGSCSAIPIASPAARRAAFARRFGRSLPVAGGDLTRYPAVESLLRRFRPEAVVQLGEMPSAPYSMIDVRHAAFTQVNNLVGTLNLLFAMKTVCRNAHLVKLGTMGEYGTPAMPIPEGFFEVEYRGHRDRLPFPRQAGSWYHLSKVHDSHNITLACRIWGLRSTDLMQGVVYGTRIDEMGADPRLATRLDFDQCFGTALNRFVCQAVIGHPLTPFGTGEQKRGFIPLRESVECMRRVIESPPRPGEYRVFNQFAEVHSVVALAGAVARAASVAGLSASVRHLENPRTEAARHPYEPDHEGLRRLGYRPARDLHGELVTMIRDVRPHRARILRRRHVLIPDIRWDGRRRRAEWLAPAATRRRPS